MSAFRSKASGRIAPRLFVLCLIVWAGAGACAAQDRRPDTQANRLFQAAWHHEEKALDALLAKGVSPNAPNSQKIPPLVAVLSNGPYDDQQLEMVRLLLKRGANPNGVNSLGWTALMSIVQQQDERLDDHVLRAMTILLDAKADINYEDSQHSTALTRAMGSGRPRRVRFLLERGADINLNGGYLKYTPLHYVACAGDTERVKTLLKAGADVNAGDVLGETPLTLAARSGSVPTVQALLDAGADVNAGRADVRNALQHALETKNPETALLLLKHGARVNISDDRVGDTPLLQALRAGGTNSVAQWDGVIQAILDAGADVNASDRGYSNPLIGAIEREKELNAAKVPHIDWMKRLLDRGANPNQTVGWRSPLSAALTPWPGDTGRLEIAALLIERGADVNAEVGDERYRQALLVGAAAGEDHDAVDFLLAHGAKVNGLDNAHKTPLHWAAYQGDLDLVKRLLAKGADLQAKDMLGQSPLVLARKGKHPEVAAFLQQQGATDPQAAAPTRNARGQLVLRLPISWRNGATPPERLRFAVATSEKTPALTLFEGDRPATLPVDFTSLLGDPGIWSGSELNTILYQLQRGYYARDGYQFCGLISSHKRTYLGIRWYSPASSYLEIFTVCVFRLSVQGSNLELTLLRKTGGGGTPGNYSTSSLSKIPFISKSATGDLLMTGTDGVFALTPAEGWRKVGPPPK